MKPIPRWMRIAAAATGTLIVVYVAYSELYAKPVRERTEAIESERAAASKLEDQLTQAVAIRRGLRTIGATGEGVGEFAAALDRHFAYLERSGTLQARRRARLRERVVDAVEQRVRRRLWRDAAVQDWLDAQLPALEQGATTPLAVADTLLARATAAGTLTGPPTGPSR